jgi:hypothetical protein
MNNPRDLPQDIPMNIPAERPAPPAPPPAPKGPTGVPVWKPPVTRWATEDGRPPKRLAYLLTKPIERA